MTQDDSLSIEFVSTAGETTQLANAVAVSQGEIVDAAFMSKKALCEFYEQQIAATQDGVLFSLHFESDHDESVGSDHFWSRCESLL